MLSSNCYILGEGEEAAVIDPGVEVSEVEGFWKQTGFP